MLQRLLSVLVTLAWGLWFGGLITLFIAVQSLFTTFGRDGLVAGTGAAGIFRRFEMYQLVLAAAALLSALAWRIAAGRSKPKAAVLALLAVSTALAVVSFAIVTPRIEALRGAGQTKTPEFRSLHGRSMMVYVGQAGLLLVTGLLLPSAIWRDGRRDRYDLGGEPEPADRPASTTTARRAEGATVG